MRLGVPRLTLASKVDIDGGSVSIRRVTDEGYATVTGQLPAVVSVVEQINEPDHEDVAALGDAGLESKRMFCAVRAKSHSCQ